MMYIPSLLRGPGFLSTSPATTSNINSNILTLKDKTNFSKDLGLVNSAAGIKRCRVLELVSHLYRESAKEIKLLWIAFL